MKLVSNHENIVNVVSALIGLKKIGSHYVGCCPFHKEKTPSFTVNEEKQEYHCFGCQATGNTQDFMDSFTAGEMVALNNTKTMESEPVCSVEGTREERLEVENEYLKTLLICLLKKEIK
jgi:DNA primase